MFENIHTFLSEIYFTKINSVRNLRVDVSMHDSHLYDYLKMFKYIIYPYQEKQVFNIKLHLSWSTRLGQSCEVCICAKIALELFRKALSMSHKKLALILRDYRPQVLIKLIQHETGIKIGNNALCHFLGHDCVLNNLRIASVICFEVTLILI